MMKPMLSRESIDHLASLARIDVSTEEKEALLGELEAILAYVSEIQSLGNEKTENTGALVNANLREDEAPHESGIYSDALIAPFSDEEDRALKVKKVIAAS
jgi:aspartyl-tRNA(Asn)/glutamyl-tRNA(Gln) amidotransferase subunit C